MRTAMIALLLVTLLLISAPCLAEGKITLDAQDMPLADVVSRLTQQSQAPIVLDPKAQGSVTINLTDVSVSQALDVIANLNKLIWRKVSFALPEGDQARLEQVKLAVLALSSIPITGMVVEDPATKQASVLARNLPEVPATSAIKLPEGYSWKTFYVVTPPIVAAAKSSTGSKSQLAEMTADRAETLQALAAMTPEERQQYYVSEIAAEMSLTPEARKALAKDRKAAMRSLGSQYHDQIKPGKHTTGRSSKGWRRGGATKPSTR